MGMKNPNHHSRVLNFVGVAADQDSPTGINTQTPGTYDVLSPIPYYSSLIYLYLNLF
jgi:hypothetical protein